MDVAVKVTDCPRVVEPGETANKVELASTMLVMSFAEFVWPPYVTDVWLVIVEGVNPADTFTPTVMGGKLLPVDRLSVRVQVQFKVPDMQFHPLPKIELVIKPVGKLLVTETNPEVGMYAELLTVI